MYMINVHQWLYFRSASYSEMDVVVSWQLECCISLLDHVWKNSLKLIAVVDTPDFGKE
jgi:hypothetical protein